MTYYIIDPAGTGKYAAAIFEIAEWIEGSGWGPDVSQDFEVNVPSGSVMTWEEYQETVDWWAEELDNPAEENMIVLFTEWKELKFILGKDDLGSVYADPKAVNHQC